MTVQLKSNFIPHPWNVGSFRGKRQISFFLSSPVRQ